MKSSLIIEQILEIFDSLASRPEEEPTSGSRRSRSQGLLRSGGRGGDQEMASPQDPARSLCSRASSSWRQWRTR